MGSYRGPRNPVPIALTANITLAKEDCGGVFTNQGATSAVVVTLPAVLELGAVFVFTVVAPQPFTVQANGGQTIQFGSASVSSIVSLVSGATVLLTGITGNAWSAVSAVGDWGNPAVLPLHAVTHKFGGTDPVFGVPGLALKTTDQLNIGTTYTDVTGTKLSVAAGQTYGFEFVLICDADALTTGIDVAVNGPASPTAIVYEQWFWTSLTVQAVRPATAYDANTASTDSNGATRAIFRVRGILVNGANAGSIIARAKREAVGSGPNVRTGSYGRLTQLS